MVDLSLLDAEDISNLTDAQEKDLSFFPIVTALLSCWGSVSIICMVLHTWKIKQTPCRRTLLGMNVCNLMSSLVCPLQSFLVPVDSSQQVWVIGTDTACSGQGFFQQVAFSNVWCCAMLSFYFLLTVKFGVPRSILVKRCEPWMHLLSIGFP